MPIPHRHSCQDTYSRVAGGKQALCCETIPSEYVQPSTSPSANSVWLSTKVHSLALGLHMRITDLGEKYINLQITALRKNYTQVNF